MDMLLDIAKTHYPEMRRWTSYSEQLNGTRVLADKQTNELLEIPQYHFCFFLGGEPKVIPHEIAMTFFRPYPSITIPKIERKDDVKVFMTRMEKMAGGATSYSVEAEGLELYFRHWTTFPKYAEGTRTPLPTAEDEDAGCVRLREGDTLFQYSFFHETQYRTPMKLSNMDYIPSSMLKSTVDTPAKDMFTFEGSVYDTFWDEIWVERKQRKKKNG